MFESVLSSDPGFIALTYLEIFIYAYPTVSHFDAIVEKLSE